MQEYIKVAKVDKNKIKPYDTKIITDEIILTYERLNNHILKYHKEEYYQIEKYMKDIIEDPDFIIEDNAHSNTLIFLKHIIAINKKARIVIKLAIDNEEKIYTKNSIITIMRQQDKCWNQTLKNRGRIIFEND